MTPDKAFAFLKDIETGRVTLTPVDEEINWCGNVIYRASNGWTIIVFNDCDSFDYIDRIEDDKGDTLDFDDYFGKPEWDRIENYDPPDNVSRDVYKIK